MKTNVTNHDLITTINQRGYAVVPVSPTPDDPFEAHRHVARSLGLPEAYTPQLYRDPEVLRSVTQPGPYNEIPRADSPVAAWSEVPGQQFHVDGLLEPIGGIKTTLLHCLTQAHSGGATQLYFTCDAFSDLAAIDKAAAQSLTNPQALTRFATIPGTAPEQLRSTGPAFDKVDGTLSTRYSDGATELWNTDQNPNLQRALAYLRGPALDNHVVDVVLAPGEMLIFRNDRVSHRGRPYRNGARPRRLTRSMYSAAPSQGK